jgi:ectoine hydroxylase-related dioxygenase (phytanoyl-CoA dioxygenase family)
MNDKGYSITPNLLADCECEDLISMLSQTLKPRGRAGSRHLMSNPIVAALANDNRLMQIARQYLGARAAPFRATLFEKSARANWLVVWHQDTALPLTSYFESREWGPWSQKAGILYAHAPAWALQRILALRVHLDASTCHNGPLRIIPASDAAGLLTDDEVYKIAKEQAAIECLVPRGGVLAMRPLLIHSSSKAREAAPRRVLHIEYADALKLADGIHLAIA